MVKKDGFGQWKNCSSISYSWKWQQFGWFRPVPSHRAWLQTRAQAWSIVKFLNYPFVLVQFDWVWGEECQKIWALFVFFGFKTFCRMFSNFAFSFSIISVLTGITTVYNTGLSFGGPISFVYGWLITGCFTMLVGLSMAEICSSYPTSGGLYYWSAKLAGPNWAPLASWLTGW